MRPYRVAGMLRRKTVSVAAASNRLFVRRAFTCYEMNSLLADTPSLRQPCLILDPLNNSHDDHVPAHEADRLLKSCLGQIHRLRLSAPTRLGFKMSWSKRRKVARPVSGSIGARAAVRWQHIEQRDAMMLNHRIVISTRRCFRKPCGWKVKYYPRCCCNLSARFL